MKERLMVKRLLDFIENDTEYHVALVSGLRRTGKTTILKQLRKYYPDSVYIDLSVSDDGYLEIEEKFFDNPTSLLLLDEISHLDDYEMISQSLYDYAGGNKKCKIIITGSSMAHISKLLCSKLGGGRARLFRLPLLTFVEYLYFTDKIKSYSDYNEVSNDYFADYLLLKGLDETDAADLAITFNGRYFESFYSENTIGNANTRLSHSKIHLKPDDLDRFVDLIAYKLSDICEYNTIIRPKVGRKEQINLSGASTKLHLNRIDVSDAFVSISSKVITKVPTDAKGRILNYLLESGLAYIIYNDRTLSNDIEEKFDVGTVLDILSACTKESELIRLFGELSINVVSPLFYTRLGIDILNRAGISPEFLCSGMLHGMMLEMYLCGAICGWSEKVILTNRKLGNPNIGEVDIFDEKNRLLCESTISDKRGGEIHVNEYFKTHPLIRICTTRDKDTFNGDYYKIPYAKLCCMADTGDIFDLKKTKAADTSGLFDGPLLN